MESDFGHLTYCTNIHSGESWNDHFSELKKSFPEIKEMVSPHQPLGLGLRLSNQASIELTQPEKLKEFKNWLEKEKAYVFTMNGFPYGDFHLKRVKEAVHDPNWATDERVNYTKRIFDILKNILPTGMEGGISTSPLAYRHEYDTVEKKSRFLNTATLNILKIVEQLIHIKNESGQILHLDIEPEPDGVLETGTEFISWYENTLLPLGREYLTKKLSISNIEAEVSIKNHIQLCYDVCHFALGYENHQEMINTLASKGIKIGKIQISAALKAKMNHSLEKRKELAKLFSLFDEDIYLHQVIAKTDGERKIRYKDLPDALADTENTLVNEWRAHFHVPIFKEEYNELQSTQDEILEVLEIHKKNNITKYLEVETYTWSVLPDQFQLPLTESIGRELLWVKERLKR